MRKMPNCFPCQRTLILLSQLLLILELGVTECKSFGSPPSMSLVHPFTLPLPGKQCLDDGHPGLIFVEGGNCCADIFFCDGFVDQCSDLNLDEGREPGQGCNLFPDSGCESHAGKRHFKCQRTGECFKTDKDAETCERGLDSDPLRTGCPEGEWKCFGGGCIPLHKICDGSPDCNEVNQTSSDEDEAFGCNLFNDQECKSLGGRNYTRCSGLSSEDPLICTDQTVKPGAGEMACRQCPEKDMWRCNDGQCISRNKTQSGFHGCLDGSDERAFPLTVYNVVFVILSLILASSLFIGGCKAVKGFSHVNEAAGKDHLNVMFPDSEIPVKLIKLLDDIENSWTRVGLGRNQKEPERDQEVEDLVLGRWARWSVMKEGPLQIATKLYKEAHARPVQLRHLFAYLVNRSPTQKELSRVAKYVMSWEMDLHRQSKTEVGDNFMEIIIYVFLSFLCVSNVLLFTKSLM